MAIRNVLHRNKLEEFKRFLTSLNYKLLEPKGFFEVLRWKNDKGEPMPIIFNGSSPEHLSCNNAARPFIYKFINQNKTKKNAKQNTK